MRHSRAFQATPEMSKRLLLGKAITAATLAVALSYASAEEYTVAKNQWLHIPVAVPEKKAGGGDFYTLKFEPVNAGGETDYEVLEEGIKIRFTEPGSYTYRLVINHITKPSCAGVTVDEYANNDILIHVLE